MKKTMSFEEALTALEQAVRKLESGEQTLDESLSTFEEAIKLIKLCNSKLDTVEQRVRILVSDSDGSVVDKEFSTNDGHEA